MRVEINLFESKRKTLLDIFQPNLQNPSVSSDRVAIARVTGKSLDIVFTWVALEKTVQLRCFRKR